MIKFCKNKYFNYIKVFENNLINIIRIKFINQIENLT